MTWPVDMGMARRYAEAGMRSTCTISTADAEAGWDEATGTYSQPEPGDIVYSGPCRIRSTGTVGRTAEAGEVRIAPSTFQVAIPVLAAGSAAVRRGMRVLIDNSPDPGLAGRRFVVRFTPASGDDITARRLLCEEAA